VIPQFDGNNLFAASGDFIGCIKDRRLVRIMDGDEFPESFPLCEFAINEYGKLFEVLIINDQSTGMLLKIDRCKIKIVPPVDGYYNIKYNDMEPINDL
jgi:hypothetical protein